MKRTAVLPALCIAALVTAAPATSAPARDKKAPVTSVDRILQRMDRDNDGKVNFEEYRNAMTRRFHAVDADGDGFLEQNEVPGEWLAVGSIDLADGKVTAEEFATGMQSAFDGFDLDHDTTLDNEELTTFAKARAAKLGETP